MAPRPLFRRFDVFTIQLHREETAREAVRAIPAERLAQQEEGVTEIANGLKMELPTLLEAEIYQTDRQVKIDARGLPNRMILDRSRPAYVDGTEITIHVPFEGDPALFDVSPSTHDLNPPVAEIDGQKKEIVLTYQTADANSPIKAQFERTLASIKQHLEWLRPAITETEGLKQVIRGEIAKRLQATTAHNTIAVSTGLPRR